MEPDSPSNRILVECGASESHFGELPCQTAALIIAGPAGLIAGIAAFGATPSRMKRKPRSARFTASPCWPTIGPIARTGTRARAVLLAQSILPGLMRVDIGGFPGTDLLHRSLSKAACAVNVALPSTMGYLLPRLRVRRSSSAATCTTCNGGSGNIRMRKRL